VLSYLCILLAGTPYDMGFAQGVLMKDKVQGMMNSAWNFFELQVVCHSDCVACMCNNPSIDKVVTKPSQGENSLSCVMERKNI